MKIFQLTSKLIIVATVFAAVLLLSACGGGGSSEDADKTSGSSDTNASYASCDTMTNPAWKEMCLAGVAMQRGDLQRCLSFSSAGGNRLACVAGIAKNRNDVSVCDSLLPDQGGVNLCKMGFSNKESSNED